MSAERIGDWETAFVAVGVIVGESVEDMAAATPVGDAPGPAAELLTRLRGASKDARVRALARAVSEVALAIDALRLA